MNSTQRYREELEAKLEEAKKDFEFRSACYKSDMNDHGARYVGTDDEQPADLERQAELTEEYEKEKLRHIVYITYRENELKTFLNNLRISQTIKKKQQKRAKNLNKLNHINIF
jgi:hypothetical protein